ncbi:SGNH/GDSL hydrolase family protein [Planctomycetota bacterium]
MKSPVSLQTNQTIVFIGDSITDAGRLEIPYRPFGCGYVHFLAYQMLAKYPQHNLNLINTGISGNTIRDLDQRWERDCLDLKPDILSVLIGINDVCRQYYDSQNEPVFLDEYELTYQRVLTSVKQKSDCRIILIQPFLFCEDTDDPIYKTLRKYIEVVNKLADKFDALLIPLQDFIDKKIRQIPPHKWSDDMMHPYIWAHAWIAQRWAETTGL